MTEFKVIGGIILNLKRYKLLARLYVVRAKMNIRVLMSACSCNILTYSDGLLMDGNIVWVTNVAIIHNK